MNKNLLLVSVGLIAGVAIGYFFYQGGYNKAMDACRTILESTGLSQASPESMKTASGRIVSIADDKVTMEFYPPTDLLKQGSAAPVPFSRVGVITDKTVLLSRRLDSNRSRSLPADGIPVSPFVESQISPKDLVLNSVVDIISFSDIRTDTEFSISKLVVNEQR